MTRILWIIGLSIALLVSSGSIIICLVALVTHRHLNLKGWTVLVGCTYGVRLIYGWLRSAIRYGDPTKSAAPNATV
jgi:hypothetical protein